MNKLNSVSFAGLAIIAALVMTSTANGQFFIIDWHKIAAGGGSGSTTGFPGGEIEILGTIAQHDAATMLSANFTFELTGGFGAPVASTQLNWAGNLNGSFFNPGLWDEQFPPTSNDTVLFDMNVPAFNLEVDVPVSTSVSRLFVLDGRVTLDFANSDLTLLDESVVAASLVIGRKANPNAAPVLKIINSGNAPHGLITKSISLGDHPDASGYRSLLEINGPNASLTSDGHLWIGRLSGGEMLIDNGGLANTTGNVSLGAMPLVDGFITVNGLNSRWNATGGSGLPRMIIGERGIGKLEILGGARATATGYAAVILGEQLNSFGRVIINGSASQWQLGQSIQVGQNGAGEIVLLNGGSITTPPGLQGSLPTIALSTRGELRGSGSIDGNVLSFGSVRPGRQADVPTSATGVMTVSGNYEQVQPGSGGNLASGVLHMRITGPAAGTQYDQLFVGGQARLGGGLFIDIPNNYSPSVNQSFSLIQADSVFRTFDVSLLPSIATAQNPKFMRVVYPPASLRGDGSDGGGSVTITVASLLFNMGFDPLEQGLPSGDPVNIAVGDLDQINGDDLVIVATSGAQTSGLAFVLLNQGDGTFNIASFDVGIDPSALALGDINSDAHPDIIVANRKDGVQNGDVTMYVNNGLGAFTPFGPPIVVGRNPSHVAAAPMIAASRLGGVVDILVTNEDDNNLMIFTNDGAGGFQPIAQGAINLPLKPVIVNPSDIEHDRDLDLDIAVVNAGAGTISIILNNGGVFETGLEYSVGTNPRDIAVATLDNDDLPDLVVANAGSGSVSILRNTSNPVQVSFAQAVNINIGAEARSVFAADLDGDSAGTFADLDIAVLVGSGENAQIKVLRNDTDGQTLNAPLLVAPAPTVESAPHAVVHTVGEIDGESGPDPITLNGSADGMLRGGAGSLKLLRNNSTSAQPLCPADVAPPLKGDGVVNVNDLLAVINAWGPCPAPPDSCPIDFQPPGGDGAVNVNELLGVINAWGACPID